MEHTFKSFYEKKSDLEREIYNINQELIEFKEEDRKTKCPFLIFLEREKKTNELSELSADSISIEEFRKKHPVRVDLFVEAMMDTALEKALLYILYKKGGKIPRYSSFVPVDAERDYNWIMTEGTNHDHLLITFDECCHVRGNDPEYFREAFRIAKTLKTKDLSSRVEIMRSDSNRKVYPYLEDEEEVEDDSKAYCKWEKSLAREASHD